MFKGYKNNPVSKLLDEQGHQMDKLTYHCWFHWNSPITINAYILSLKNENTI